MKSTHYFQFITFHKKFQEKSQKNIDKPTFFWYNSNVAKEAQFCMRLYLSWIEGSATNRNAGGSSPSRRARKVRTHCVRIFLFLVFLEYPGH